MDGALSRARAALPARRNTATAQDDRAAPSGTSAEPLYAQVARALKDEIIGGTFPVGALLPTEDVLATRFAVSRHTVREALRRLRDDGLVASRQGAGTVVVPPTATGSYVLNALTIGDLAAFAKGTRFPIESTGMVTVDAPLAARTGIAAGEAWLAVAGYRHAEETGPICHTEFFIHRDFAAVGRLLQRYDGPVFALIEDMFGENIVEVRQEIGAALLPPVLAERLGVPPGSAALEVRRAYLLADGRTAQVTINTHPAARFRHATTMRRVKP